jgi:hypothetical protein
VALLPRRALLLQPPLRPLVALVPTSLLRLVLVLHL